MTYNQLQQQIATRLYNRTDLGQVIYDFSQQVIQSYMDTLLYVGDVQDTSIVTLPGVFLYNIPQNIRQINRIRLLLSAIQGSGASVSGSGLFGAPQTTLSSSVTFPQSSIAVKSPSGFTSAGSLNVGGSAGVGGIIVNYTGVSGNDFTGCVTGSTATVGAGTIVTQVATATSLSASTTFPTATVDVASTTGFSQQGTLFVGSLILAYNGITSTSFTNVSILQGLGGTNFPALTQFQATYAAGTTVQQGSGVWITLKKMPYRETLLLDDLQPPVTTIPSRWSPFTNQVRLYPAPGAPFQLEITGKGMPSAPTNDTDDNFWTEDAAFMIIAGTTAEIMETYLGDAMAVRDAVAHRRREEKERKRLLKVSLQLGGPNRLEAHGWGYNKGVY